MPVPAAPTTAEILETATTTTETTRGQHPQPPAERPAQDLLDSSHPAFGQRVVADAASSSGKGHDGDSQSSAPTSDSPRGIRAGRELLDAAHPAFGTDKRHPAVPDSDRFEGPVTIGGFFLALSPTFSLPTVRHKMRPKAQLTIRDSTGRASRVRYACRLHGARGLKFEALLRFQVGWIAPRVKFTELPFRIQLGRGFDVGVPLLFHFTAVSILDERGNPTGSCLFFSGTPLMGFSLGFVRITHGELVHAPTRPVDPETDSRHFIGHVHYRQLGFLVFKALGYVACAVAALFNLSEIYERVKAFAVPHVTPYVERVQAWLPSVPNLPALPWTAPSAADPENSDNTTRP